MHKSKIQHFNKSAGVHKCEAKAQKRDSGFYQDCQSLFKTKEKRYVFLTSL